MRIRAKVTAEKFEGSSGHWWYLKLKLKGHAAVWLNEHYRGRRAALKVADKLRA